jgi:hypothetical protein
MNDAAPTGLGNGVARVATKISLWTERRTVLVASVCDRRNPALIERRYRVDEFVGTVSQDRRG